MITFELLSPGKYLPNGYWSQTVPGTERVEIEIGPGDGGFLISAAARDPYTAWIGLEIRRPSVELVAQRDDLPGNARVHGFDGRWVIPHLIASSSVDAYHIYFPDPWWKKRHQKRRLFTEEFAEGLLRTLKPGALAYVMTDVVGLFSEIRTTLTRTGLIERPWERNAADAAQSSYERKYRRQGRRFYSASFERVSR